MFSRSTLLRRLAPVAVAVAIIAAPAAAQADDALISIDINPGNIPTTAAAHTDHSCDQVPDDVASDQDGWVFVLPSDHGDKGEFVSVTATFTDLDGDEHTYTTDDNGGIAEPSNGKATSKAFILTPAGLSLTGANAEVSGITDLYAKFNLTHTCVGSSDDEPGGDEPSEDETSPDENAAAGDEDETLPVTGTSLTVAFVSGLAMIALGAAVLISQRRRHASWDAS